jgi:hypothetical protein
MPQYMYGDYLPEDDYPDCEYRSEDDAGDPWGCRYPEDCIELHPHRISECRTPEMAAEMEEHLES